MAEVKMYYLIACENGKKRQSRLTARNIISIVTYFLATTLGGLCPPAAFIVVAAVSCWWIVPQKRQTKASRDDE